MPAFQPVMRARQDAGSPWGGWLGSIFGGAAGSAGMTTLLGSLFGGPIGAAAGGAVGAYAGQEATEAAGAGPSSSVKIDPGATWQQQQARRKQALASMLPRQYGGGY